MTNFKNALILLCGVAVGMSVPIVGLAQSTSLTAGPQYVLPGDFVRVAFSVERELGGDFAVDDAGEVILPLLGIIQVTNQPTDSLRTRLRSAYASQVQNQAVQVQFLHRVTVLGSVTQPGLYHADGTMTVQDLLALAGGVKEDGERDLADIRRRGEQVRTRVSTAAFVSEVVRSGDELNVPQRSWLSRNSAAVFGGVVSTVAIFVSRSWYR